MKHNAALEAEGILVQWDFSIFLPFSEPGNGTGNLLVCQSYEITTGPSYIPLFCLHTDRCCLIFLIFLWPMENTARAHERGEAVPACCCLPTGEVVQWLCCT